MNKKTAIYDSPASKDISIEKLVEIFKGLGVSRVLYKSLSPNDNSKNQPYLAGHLTDLGFIPTGEITESKSTSGKTKDPKRQIKYTASLDYSWVSSDGQLFTAPDAKLIYYPQYPEVRLSGFVTKCNFDMGGWMDPLKKGRSSGRVLFFGLKDTGEILAYLAVPDTRIAKEIHDYPSVTVSGVFNEIALIQSDRTGDSKDILISELCRIHQKEWIAGKKLNPDRTFKEYKAQNGGGYTMEAELGIIPNGIAEPDFMGWEIKQFGVKKCHLINSKPLTVMTPEPDGGFYVEQGVEAFVRKYGYTSTDKPDRYDFTGRHFSGTVCDKSGLLLVTQGYDPETDTITDGGGSIALLDNKGNPASIWTFAKIMAHWKRKHAKAAYIPSLSRNESDKSRCYSYCNNVRLFEGTTFNKLLKGIAENHVYYDPGINIKNADTKPVSKRRSQFRIKSSELHHLYHSQEDIDVLKP
ncbi:MAG: MvaI/BcnI restriction endonuclease family protein [Gammaproteobacteria bacterium]|nr:MvaI/BcnI restriction endonuclease family protein [Gammaproteobacteria bacterium]